MSSVVEIREHFQELQNALGRFRFAWIAEAVDAEVFVLPLNASGLAPISLPVKLLKGNAALQAAERAFEQLLLFPEQHPKTVYRLPGWIGIRRDLQPEILAINTIKDSLAACFQEHSQVERRRLARQALPQVSLKQCYRHLVQWNPTPSKVYFSWAGATPSSMRVSREQVLDQLDAAEEKRPARFTHAEWQALIVSHRHQVGLIPPNLPLVYRWRKAPHPRVMAYDRGQTSNVGRIVPANLPVFLVMDTETRPLVTPLEDFDIRNHLREVPRADAALLATVIEGLHLYAKLRP